MKRFALRLKLREAGSDLSETFIALRIFPVENYPFSLRVPGEGRLYSFSWHQKQVGGIRASMIATIKIPPISLDIKMIVK